MRPSASMNTTLGRFCTRAPPAARSQPERPLPASPPFPRRRLAPGADAPPAQGASAPAAQAPARPGARSRPDASKRRTASAPRLVHRLADLLLGDHGLPGRDPGPDAELGQALGHREGAGLEQAVSTWRWRVSCSWASQTASRTACSSAMCRTRLASRRAISGLRSSGSSDARHAVRPGGLDVPHGAEAEERRARPRAADPSARPRSPRPRSGRRCAARPRARPSAGRAARPAGCPDRRGRFPRPGGTSGWRKSRRDQRGVEVVVAAAVRPAHVVEEEQRQRRRPARARRSGAAPRTRSSSCGRRR